jgi:hypothetical protein
LTRQLLIEKKRLLAHFQNVVISERLPSSPSIAAWLPALWKRSASIQPADRSYLAGFVGVETSTGLSYTHKRADLKAFYSRLIMALFGGLALIVPMLIMTLHRSKLTSLLTTSVFVLGLAVVLAWIMDTADPKDIIGATAAYAAVLVVFVGTASNA